MALTIRKRLAAETGQACRDAGFFHVRGHGAGDDLLTDLGARVPDRR
jgi:isopenicillin N synthase-like dioxygenase